MHAALRPHNRLISVHRIQHVTFNSTGDPEPTPAPPTTEHLITNISLLHDGDEGVNKNAPFSLLLLFFPPTLSFFLSFFLKSHLSD